MELGGKEPEAHDVANVVSDAYPFADAERPRVGQHDARDDVRDQPGRAQRRHDPEQDRHPLHRSRIASRDEGVGDHHGCDPKKDPRELPAGARQLGMKAPESHIALLDRVEEPIRESRQRAEDEEEHHEHEQIGQRAPQGLQRDEDLAARESEQHGAPALGPGEEREDGSEVRVQKAERNQHVPATKHGQGQAPQLGPRENVEVPYAQRPEVPGQAMRKPALPPPTRYRQQAKEHPRQQSEPQRDRSRSREPCGRPGGPLALNARRDAAG